MDYILDGIKNGFALIDPGSELPTEPVETDNYHSATSPTACVKVEKQINTELEEGNYSITHTRPLITSALGAIPKNDSGIRLIHDASRPVGRSLNDLASREECKFQTFNDAVSLLRKNSYCAKVDLQAAYRSCGIREKDKFLTGLKWKFTGSDHFVYMTDNRLPFGARKSVYHFNRITQSIRRMMANRGYKIVVYVDDFLLVEKDQQSCLAAYNTLIKLLRSLGFSINWSKALDPAQIIVFLGIEINTRAGTLTLDSVKKSALIDLLHKTMNQKRLSKNQLQSLAGKMAWAGIVTPWGKTHTCAFFRLLSLLNKPCHKVMTKHLHSSIKWWLECLSIGNNTRLIWDNRPCVSMYTDSSRPSGGGFCFDGDWVYKHWRSDVPSIADSHINIKELRMGHEAVARWAPKYPNTRLCLFMDNIPAVHMVNSGKSRNAIALDCIRTMSLIALKFNVAIEAFYIPGAFNDIADSISRFHMKGQIARFISLVFNGLWPVPCTGYWLCNHMSYRAQLSISAQVRQWRGLHSSWMQRLQVGGVSHWPPPRKRTIDVTRAHIYNSAVT